ncbi:MAG: MdtA/MuxA family multidrug efflux RND transporter periplasmic adaptor subunit [Candidatus Accumulibacter sp.]|jgi:multidrug efflux system membrane fusion protein|nr:MdtA/MuxA family multidrug efflux RND transporter periplasmic adaptor subunit [Accumulibacter sp.]
MRRQGKNTKIIGSIFCGLVALGAVSYYLVERMKSQPPASSRNARRWDPSLPVPVGAAEIRRGDIDVIVRALGTVTARNTVMVKSRVDGQLLKINFQEGQFVREGDVLAEIDSRPFQAQFEQARGQLMRDEALLRNAKIDRDRYATLLAKDSIARQQVDTQEALVAQYQGVVRANRGLVDNARLQLEFTRIRAPLSGRLGLRLVDVGNMVRASDAAGIVVITQTQPVTAVFAIAADTIGAVLKPVRAGESLQVEAWDREGKTRLATGKLLSLDNQIDTATGTVKLKAEFENADNSLFPNQFVNIRLRVETRRDAMLAPVSAIQRGAPGTFVYLIHPEEKKVEIRRVTLGPATADVVAIEEGLQSGDIVVVTGADRLRQNAAVEFSLDGKPMDGTGGARQGEEAGNAVRKKRGGDDPVPKGRNAASGEREEKSAERAAGTRE